MCYGSNLIFNFLFLWYFLMPRAARPSSFNKFRHSRNVAKNRLSQTGHTCFWVTMTRLSESRPYMKNFYNRHPSCNYVEFYTVPNPETGTYDLYGYIQLNHPSTISQLIDYFNCRTTLKSTTIAEKMESPFHNDCAYNKEEFGVQRLSVKNSKWASDFNRTALYSTGLSVDLAI